MKLDVERGLQFVETLRLDIEPLLLDGDVGKVEHMAHEIAHGLSLDIPIVRGFDKRITSRLEGLDDKGIEEEALVLAAEGILFRWLGHEIGQCELECAANIQSVPLIELYEKQKSFAAKELAHRILAWFRAHGIVT